MIQYLPSASKVNRQVLFLFSLCLLFSYTYRLRFWSVFFMHERAQKWEFCSLQKLILQLTCKYIRIKIIPQSKWVYFFILLTYYIFFCKRDAASAYLGIWIELIMNAQQSKIIFRQYIGGISFRICEYTACIQATCIQRMQICFLKIISLHALQEVLEVTWRLYKLKQVATKCRLYKFCCQYFT